jgi:hypothetical protein
MSSRRERLLELHKEITEQARSIMVAKNADYTANSDDPYANFRSATFVGAHPVCGVLMRSMDKFMRIRSFAEQGTLQVKGESVQDAIRDVINYMVIIAGLIEDAEPTAVQGDEKTVREFVRAANESLVHPPAPLRFHEVDPAKALAAAASRASAINTDWVVEERVAPREWQIVSLWQGRTEVIKRWTRPEHVERFLTLIEDDRKAMRAGAPPIGGNDREDDRAQEYR